MGKPTNSDVAVQSFDWQQNRGNAPGLVTVRPASSNRDAAGGSVPCRLQSVKPAVIDARECKKAAR
jgi:hypothetical protein